MKFRTKQPVGPKKVNLAGGKAYGQSPQLELISILLTNFVKEQYYRSVDDTIDRIRELVFQIDPLWTAKAAIYAREVFGMRSITHVLAGELSNYFNQQFTRKNVPGKTQTRENPTWLKDFYTRISFRPDDMLEILGYIGQAGYPLTNAMRKGFAQAIEHKFNEYQLAKYKGKRANVSLVDLVNLCHPRGPLAKKIIKGTLKVPDTWEVKLSAAGQAAGDEEEKAELKAEVWEELLNDDKLGYFALLRNLRNIAEQAPTMLDLALKKLVNPKAIHDPRNLVMPFRYMTALQTLGKSGLVGTPAFPKIRTALNKAMEIAVDNIPRLAGETLVALDASGSMGGDGWGPESPVTLFDLANLFATALVRSKNKIDLMQFSNDAKYYQIDPADTFGTVFQQIKRERISGGTNFPSIFKNARKKYDNIIIITDEQGWMEGGAPKAQMAAYNKNHRADPRIFVMNVAGYGTSMFPEKKMCYVAGFSEKVFDLMALLDQDEGKLVELIDQLQIVEEQ